LRMAQFISIVLIIVAIGIWMFRRTKGLAKERYLD
jgi:phosphatidylglycerol:prolipoprotein diacylglycerol transferase